MKDIPGDATCAANPAAHPALRCWVSFVSLNHRLISLGVVLIAGLVLVGGCARHYVITLNNGARVYTSSKPKLDKGNYTFKDSTGALSSVSSGRVREIAPASMSKDSGEKFLPQK